LSYYGPNDAPLFAGREQDVSICAEMLALTSTRILLLHGTTGCGKSSFLHAGLIPYLETVDVGFQFLKDKGNRLKTIFVRSTDNPLAELAKEVYNFALGDVRIRSPKGDARLLHLPEVVSEFTESEFIEKSANSDVFLLEMLSGLTKKLTKTLVLIIDQGEEVITLKPDQAAAPHRNRFFDFLARLSRVNSDLKLLIALRTEYYGRVVGRMQRFGMKPSKLMHYLLDELNEQQVVSAIKWPTSDKPYLNYGNPWDHYQFSFGVGVPELIASDVVSKRMAGGVLPVMQLICSRLYEAQNKKQRKPSVVTQKDYRDLGGIEDQMDFHFNRVFAEMCRRQNIPEREHSGEAARWKSVLSALARTQPDNTITTDIIDEEKLKSAAESAKCKLSFAPTMAFLIDPGQRILRPVDLVDVKEGEVIKCYSLAHDAIGLALNRWKQTNEEASIYSRRFRRYAKFFGILILTSALILWLFGQFLEPYSQFTELLALILAINAGLCFLLGFRSLTSAPQLFFLMSIFELFVPSGIKKEWRKDHRYMAYRRQYPTMFNKIMNYVRPWKGAKPMSRVTSPPKKPMVGWYAPAQLAQTAVQVGISTIFGRHLDHRLVEALASGDDVPGDYTSGTGVFDGVAKPFYDYTSYHLDDGRVLKRELGHPRNSIWIDYVADVGDGWNSTYAVAYYLGDPAGRTFQYADRDTGQKYEVVTKRGEILVFGGDEVYPTASRQEYNDRLVAPYETALRNSPGAGPHVFAIPGNHDWSDGLLAFRRLFTGRPWFAGWRTRQSRSYFALKLPHNWWLLGTDLQAGSDIDKPQMNYFEGVVAEMDEETKRTGQPARIIVCHAEPHWVRAAQYGEDPLYNESNLKLLEMRLGQNVAVFIAGNSHHYRRHESEDKTTQKITAGGGGAFLHPTHVGILGKNLDELVEKGLRENEERNFKLEACFPATKASRRACWRNLLFPFFVFQGNQSWSFGLLTAALYLFLTLPIVFSIDDHGSNGELWFGQITYTAMQSLLHNSASILLIVVMIIGFVFFTDTHSTLYRLIMGGLHGVAHVQAACGVALLTVFAIAQLTAAAAWTFRIPWPGGFYFSVDLRLLLAALMVFVLGFVVGPFVMGVYLLISLNFFGRHGNEAFSSLAIEDWKNFIRLHINEEGDLTIYPIGIRRVPRRWKARDHGTGPEEVPNDPKATDPELIEPPIVMKSARTGTGVLTKYT
jgi:hypothetical protein